MATNSREARRRKIMERGSDRLALITGQIQTLPSSSSSSPPPDPATHSEHTDPPSQPSIFPDQIPETHVPDKIPVFAREIEENRSAPSTVQDESPPSTVQDESPPLSLSFEKPRLFTASRISGAIEASERTRIYISMAVALLVVFAHVGFPLLGNNMVKTLLGFRPLYLVLVTNVTLVLAQIFESGRQRLPRVPAGFGERQTMSGSEYEWVERLGKAVGIGLFGKKVLDALFMDCAVYAIIVVCGLSFVQHIS